MCWRKAGWLGSGWAHGDLFPPVKDVTGSHVVALSLALSSISISISLYSLFLPSSLRPSLLPVPSLFLFALLSLTYSDEQLDNETHSCNVWQFQQSFVKEIVSVCALWSAAYQNGIKYSKEQNTVKPLDILQTYSLYFM